MGAPKAALPTLAITSKLISDQTNICTGRCILVKMEDAPRVGTPATSASPAAVASQEVLGKPERAIILKATYRTSRLRTKAM